MEPEPGNPQEVEGVLNPALMVSLCLFRRLHSEPIEDIGAGHPPHLARHP
jgi:hypothetical protein